METFVSAFLTTAVALDVWAVAAVIRSRHYGKSQIAWQAVVVLLLPVLGSLLVLVLLWSQRSSPVQRRSDTNHEHWENAQDKAHGVE